MFGNLLVEWGMHNQSITLKPISVELLSHMIFIVIS
jgi:hypothetical protein